MSMFVNSITDIGVLKAGGQSLPKDAPGRKGRLESATIQYEFVGDAESAVLKLWGYDGAWFGSRSAGPRARVRVRSELELRRSCTMCASSSSPRVGRANT